VRSELAIPSALELLERHITSGADAATLALPLRALQMRGLTKLDLTVHVERMRATNAATDDDEHVEETCLLALELIEGRLRPGLVWDAAHHAASLLPRCLTPHDVRGAIPYALVPSDLLPPRPPALGLGERFDEVLADAVTATMEALVLRPVRAELIRAPKSAFTTRPAALLALPDRVLLEALASQVEASLPTALPDAVIWPRARGQIRGQAVPPSYGETVLAWGSRYVVKADVAHFYESVEHSLLAVLLATRLDVRSTTARALEALLTATMGTALGLPQGPPASDVLASAYLLAVDQQLVDEGLRFLRFADDYFFPAETLVEGRAVLQRLESLLTDLGLALSPEKTSVMRRRTFRTGLERSAVHRMKLELAEAHFEALGEPDSATDAAELLERVGVPEQAIWNLVYHHTMSMEDVLAELVGDEGDEGEVQATYAMYLQGIARILREEGATSELAVLENVARESLLILQEGWVRVPNEALAQLQGWFPHLVPHIVGLLTGSATPADQAEAAEYVRTRLEHSSGVDWIDAWMCHAAASLPANRVPIESLLVFLTNERAQPLSRAEAVRALGKAGALNETEWRRVLERSSPALATEMFLAGLAERERLPWFPRYVEAAHPAIAQVAIAFGADEP
jgi:hypothetical protein